MYLGNSTFQFKLITYHTLQISSNYFISVPYQLGEDIKIVERKTAKQISMASGDKHMGGGVTGGEPKAKRKRKRRSHLQIP